MMNAIEHDDVQSRELSAAIGRIAGIDPEEVLPDQLLSELGFDSVHLMELIAALEDKYGIRLPAERMVNKVSVSALGALVSAELARAVPAGSPAAAAPGREAEGAGEAGICASAAAAPAAETRAESAPCVVSVVAQGDPLPAREVRGAPAAELQFSLLYFANAELPSAQYELLIESARLADRLGFSAVWIPERHFHSFGGIYPNPSVTAAALAMVTSQIRLRAGSVVLPLHHPVRVAEEWAFVDNLSQGRVDLAFATGWNANDFVLAPDSFERRREKTLEAIEIVRELWRGGSLSLSNGAGRPFQVSIFPKPLQRDFTPWFTCSESLDSFLAAGSHGYHVLTALLFQTPEELATKISLYRRAREQAGYPPETGHVTVMLHSFIGTTDEEVRSVVREPFLAYLESSVRLWANERTDLARLDERERARALDLAFERYFQTAALFGTPASVGPLLQRLQRAGADEIACLIDFGAKAPDVIASVARIGALKRSCAAQRLDT